MDDAFVFLFGVLYLLALVITFTFSKHATGRWTGAVLITGIAGLVSILVPALAYIGVQLAQP